MQDYIERLKQQYPVTKDFLYSFMRQVVDDKIPVTAGYLAYVTLLALVPFIMVFFAILQAFPAFQSIRGKLESFIFNNFVPAAGDTVQQYIGEFVGNASQMSAIGLLFLFVTALLLISNIDKTINLISGTKAQRRVIFTFAIYWMVLTLGPILVGTSLALSSYLLSQVAFAEDYTPGLTSALLGITPFFVSFSVYFILYMVVPNKSVKARHAAAGAVFAAILFEISKKIFAIYVTSFPSYQVIYGALAAVPILFVWVYLSWMIVLLGAVCTTQIEHLSKKKEGADSAA